jgi:hypothetical protein
MEETFNLFYKFDKILDKIKKPVYLTSIGFIYISYFLIFFGIFYMNKKYIELFSNLLLTFVCLFLIIRFHPFRKHELREFDATIIFGSAILLLTNAGLTKLIMNDITMVMNNNIINPIK